MTDLDPLNDLAPDLQQILTHWQSPCEAMFEFLAAHYPDALLQLVGLQKLKPTDLTFAAEIVGRLRDGERVRSVLIPLLQHRAAVVREGAIYGLANHIDVEVKRLLLKLVDWDPSPVIRVAAEEVLDEGSL